MGNALRKLRRNIREPIILFAPNEEAVSAMTDIHIPDVIIVTDRAMYDKLRPAAEEALAKGRKKVMR